MKTKKFKHPKTGIVIEESNPNHYSIHLREGYEEFEDKAEIMPIESVEDEIKDKDKADE